MPKTVQGLEEAFNAPSISEDARNASPQTQGSGAGSGTPPRAKVSGTQWPVISGAVMAGGLIVAGVFGGVALFGDDGAMDRLRGTEPQVVAEAPPVVAGEGTVLVPLPDRDGNGVADALQPGGEDAITGPADSPVRVEVVLPDADKNGIADMFEQPVKAPETKPVPEPVKPAPEPVVTTYAIKPGDTLAEISAETGYSVDAIAAKNKIKNPDFIYAGSSLLLPID